MKKYINTAFFYAIFAMISGVFFREFTKYNEFTGYTTLSVMHTHLFTLGMMMFLIISLFYDRMKTHSKKLLLSFYVIYNSGIILTVVLFFIRGIVQVKNVALSTGMNAAISGFAGIGHILTGVGIILLFCCIKEKK